MTVLDVTDGYSKMGGISGERSEPFGMMGRADPKILASAYESFSAPE